LKAQMGGDNEEGGGKKNRARGMHAELRELWDRENDQMGVQGTG